MERWTDKAIRQQIEELIEESYLQSLTEPEIRNYLRNFIVSCETVLRENIGLRGDISITRVKIALLRSRLLIDGSVLSAEDKVSTGADNSKHHGFLARRVVNIKRVIVTLLDGIEPTLSLAVVEEHRKRQEEFKRQFQRKAVIRGLLITAGYYLLLLLALTVLYVLVFLD